MPSTVTPPQSTARREPEAEESVVGELRAAPISDVEEREQLSYTLGKELDATTQEMLKKVGEASKKKTGLQSQIASGDRKITQLQEKLESDLKVESRAAERVKEHRKELEGLLRSLQLAADISKSAAGEQSTAAKRLQEEHSAAVAASTAARKKAEEARRLLAEAVATGKADIAQCDETVIDQEALAASAKERLDAIRAASDAVKQRLAGLKSKEAEKDRERDFHAQALKQFDQEYETAKAALEKARELKRDNDAALESHDEDAAQRLRAHEAEVRRAKDKLVRANKLRDMRTRPLITADPDKQAFAPSGEAANDSAAQASEDYSQAEMALDSLRSQDAQQRAELTKAAEKSNTGMEQRDRVLQTLDERMKIRRNAAYEARKAHAQIVAAVRTAEEELDGLNKRADGPLTEAYKSAEAKAERAREAAANARTTAATKEAPLRHAQEAEMVVLRKTEEQEAKLIQSLSASRISVSEAEADASLALGEDDKGAPEQNLVALEGQARLKRYQAEAEEAKQAVQAAESAVAKAKKERDELKQQAAKQQEEAAKQGEMPAALANTTASRVAAAEVAVEEFARVLKDAVAKHEQAQANVSATQAEISKATIPTKSGASTASLLKTELGVAEQQGALHEGQEKDLKTAVSKEEEQWKAAKDGLQAELHIASLEFTRASEDMESHENFKGQYKSA